jgi:hypothetical protein
MVLGSSYWGGCYLFAVLFYTLPFVMNLELRWSPLEFGAAWAITLVLIGLRLRRMSPDGAAAPATLAAKRDEETRAYAE